MHLLCCPSKAISSQPRHEVWMASSRYMPFAAWASEVGHSADHNVAKLAPLDAPTSGQSAPAQYHHTDLVGICAAACRRIALPSTHQVCWRCGGAAAARQQSAAALGAQYGYWKSRESWHPGPVGNSV